MKRRPAPCPTCGQRGCERPALFYTVQICDPRPGPGMAADVHTIQHKIRAHTAVHAIALMAAEYGFTRAWRLSASASAKIDHKQEIDHVPTK